MGRAKLRARLSQLVDVSDLPPSAFKTVRHRVGVRLWPDQMREARLTTYGRVMSDLRPLPTAGAEHGRPLAVRWIGHYAIESWGALVFEAFLTAFGPAAYAELGQSETSTLYDRLARLRRFLLDDVAALGPDQRRAALAPPLSAPRRRRRAGGAGAMRIAWTWSMPSASRRSWARAIDRRRSPCRAVGRRSLNPPIR